MINVETNPITTLIHNIMFSLIHISPADILLPFLLLKALFILQISQSSPPEIKSHRTSVKERQTIHLSIWNIKKTEHQKCSWLWSDKVRFKIQNNWDENQETLDLSSTVTPVNTQYMCLILSLYTAQNVLFYWSMISVVQNIFTFSSHSCCETSEWT